MDKISIKIAPILISILFIMAGIHKLTNVETMVGYMQSHGIPFAPQLLIVAALANLIGAALLISGRHVKLAAYGLFLYLLIVNFTLHDFWTMDAEVHTRELLNFIKNLSIMGGLLMTAAHATARPLSLKGWWRSDNSLG